MGQYLPSKRIGDLVFNHASYLLPQDKWPEHISYHIDLCYENPYYGHEEDYTKDGDFYIHKDIPYLRTHKDCFKHPESRIAIASFDYDKAGEIYEFRFIGDRPIALTKEQLPDFWELVKHGFFVLNTPNNEED